MKDLQERITAAARNKAVAEVKKDNSTHIVVTLEMLMKAVKDSDSHLDDGERELARLILEKKHNYYNLLRKAKLYHLANKYKEESEKKLLTMADELEDILNG